MISYEQRKIINEQLSTENALDFVKTMILCYCQTASEVTELLEFIPKIAEKGLKDKQEKINQYCWATELLLGERHMYPIPKRKSKSKKAYNPDFPTLLYVGKAHFPNGNCDGGSQAEKEFWHEFIDCLMRKQGFDYTDADNWKWIKTTANCEKWFLSVIRQNIDKDFVAPKA